MKGEPVVAAVGASIDLKSVVKDGAHNSRSPGGDRSFELKISWGCGFFRRSLFLSLRVDIVDWLDCSRWQTQLVHCAQLVVHVETLAVRSFKT